MTRIGLPALLLAVAAPAAAASDAAVEQARKLFQNQQESVVWVLAVMKIDATAGTRTAPTQEKKIEAIGTVIDASGLTVVSYSGINPSLALKGKKVRTPDGMVELKVKAEFKEVKIRLADGTEVPAKMVLTDTDLDLAFIRPDAESDEAKAAEFKPVKLDNAAKADVLDEVILLGRLNKSLDRRPMVRLGRVAAVIDKPRTFYRTTVALAGAPLFAADGRPLGITVRRMVNERPSATVILPAEAVQKVAKQALPAK